MNLALRQYWGRFQYLDFPGTQGRAEAREAVYFFIHLVKVSANMGPSRWNFTQSPSQEPGIDELMQKLGRVVVEGREYTFSAVLFVLLRQCARELSKDGIHIPPIVL